ncbi:MAG: hydroxyacid dehydrogenase [Elusimicrobiota bacterium]|jgi:D-3-phosphoglycerate dehydrogenase|nr:hydroxyacid dehydrogenase [Elusimicrobiota bacterium]
MTKILLSQDINPKARKLLDEKFEVFLPKNTAQESLVEAAKEAEGIVLRTVTSATKEVIDNAPKLKIISRTGAGVDNVDIEAASARKILVCNVPTASNISVAEHTCAMILSLAKDLRRMDKSLRRGNWKERNNSRPIDVCGKVLGIVGMGKIGSLVAKKAHLGLDMKIIAFDPFSAGNFKDEGYVFVSTLAELFQTADFITIHCPNMPETNGMINKELIDLMKPSAYLVNCARGGVVVEEALYDALKDNKIAGAGIDVFSKEPPSANTGLLILDNIIATPHSAALTKEASERVAIGAAQAVIDYFSGKTPEFVYNKDRIFKS